MASMLTQDVSEELTRLPRGTLTFHNPEHLTLAKLETKLEQLKQLLPQ